MRLSRSLRLLLLAFLLSVVPASSFAGVLISVGFPPPPLPVYEQPICPQPGLMWTPGYWSYGEDGYFWVPGAWMPAPYVGALWTPGYWGWSGGRYIFNAGYWGPHVGFYGGVNYGFGYGGIGFAGGMWRGGVFAYNTAVMHVGVGFRSVYVDRVAVDRGFVARDSHVAFNGGPGGIRHEAGPEERMAEHEQHRGPTAMQGQHAEAARSDRTSYASNNGGHPSHAAVERPLSAPNHGGGSAYGASGANGGRDMASSHSTNGQRSMQSNSYSGGGGGAERMTSRPEAQSHPNAAPRGESGGHSSAPRPSPEEHHK
jgi:hypothetical protein